MSERKDEGPERRAGQLGTDRDGTDRGVGRPPGTNPRKLLHRVVVSAAALFLCFSLAYFVLSISFVFHFDSPVEPRAFDPEAWRTADTSWNEEEEYSRRALADGLVESGRPIGMARPAVVELLGEPFETWRGDNCDVYRVGPDRGWLGIDEEFLLVDYGVDGRVEEVERFVL